MNGLAHPTASTLANGLANRELPEQNLAEGFPVADAPKSDKKTEAPADQKAAAPAAEAPQRQQVQVEDKDAFCSYANFCRVTGTPEELLLDFGLNSQPYGLPTEPVQVKQRLVMNYYTAKRMLQALHMSVQRHEQAFGVLETDVQKRVVNKGQA